MSKTPPAFRNDKLALTELCLRSFAESLGSLSAKIHVILDGCPAPYIKLFERLIGHHAVEFHHCRSIGNQATFAKQIELLSAETCNALYFAEDDYFYRPNSFAPLIDYLESFEDVDFITPYDHLDYHTMALHGTPSETRIHGGMHWRTEASSTMTFLTRPSVLRAAAPCLTSYSRGNLDCSMWLSLTRKTLFSPTRIVATLREQPRFHKKIRKAWSYSPRQSLLGPSYKLWVPSGGIATHMDVDFLPRDHDWQADIQSAASRIAPQHGR